MKFVANLRSNLDVILLSLVLCVNCIRVVLGLGGTTIALYGLYLLCFLTLYSNYEKSFTRLLRKDITIRAYFIVILLLIIYAAFSLLWITSSEVYSTYIKFLLSLMISVPTVVMPIDKIKRVISYVVIINVVYAVVLLIYPQLVDVAMGAGLNYLNATLPIGLALTITLFNSLNAISNKGGLLWSAIWIVTSAIFFASLMRFVARGVLLFPPLIAIFVFFSMKKTHKIVSWLFIPLFIGVLYFSYEYYMSNASDYALSRMMKLMESSEDEDRWSLWSKSLTEMIDKGWLIWGGGMEAFRYNSSIHFYPHNIFIQLIGEYGILGIVASILTIWNVIIGFIRSKSRAGFIGESAVLYCLTGSYFYYTLTFCKSFSLYDGLPLFIIIGFCLSLYYNLRMNVNKAHHKVK